MTPEQLRARVQEKITARTSLYNPLLQQPIRLEPVGPGSYPSGLGGYSYIGPPPDFGGSYGAYEDTAGHRQVGVLASKHFSMHDGAPMALRSELSQEEREALLSQLDKACEAYKCEHCRSELTISIAQPVEMSALHCPYCASAMSGAIDKAKACWAKLSPKENEDMSQKAAEGTKTPVETPAAPVAAATDVAKEAAAMGSPQEHMGSQAADIAKEAQKAETPAQQHPHENPDKAKPMEHSDKGVVQVKPMDELAKGLTKAGAEATPAPAAAVATPAAPADAEAVKAAAEAKRKENMKAAFQNWSKTRKERVAAMKERAKERQRTTLQASAKVRKELRIMATFNPEKFAEVKKNEKLAAVCAEVEKKLYTAEQRKQVRAELMALAKENPEAAEHAQKELDFIAPEILMEKDEVSPAAPEAPAAEAAPAEPPKKEEENMAEAMKTEFLASLDELPCTKIEMSLYGEESENPFWNLTVDAEPVARIFLQDQENQEQIKASFVSDAYAQNFGNLISKAGLRKMLELSQARVFAHRTDDTESAKRVKEKVRAELQKEFDAKVETLQGDFLRAVELAMVASNKNLYEDENSNALKGELFNQMIAANLSEQYAVEAIEAGFKAAPAYLQHLTAKAREIMSQPTEARESIEKWIMGAGVKSVEVQQTEVDKDKELMARLVSNSAQAVAMGGVVGGENREQIRAHLGLKGSARR